MSKIYSILLLIMHVTVAFSSAALYAPESIATKELIDFQSNSPQVKTIINMGLELTKQKLTYKYGSSDPHLGGMDCSGTMYYLLTKLGVDAVPRSSDELYNWIKDKGVFYNANNNLKQLRPGDLLFWTGTYSAPNNAYVTHVMIYIGKNLKGERLMLGSSNGRTYRGKKIWGVSVFDFLPFTSNTNNKFIGYSCIPQVSC